MDSVMFFHNQAPGAWPNGTRVMKSQAGELGDTHPAGAMATVVGSAAVPPDSGFNDVKYAYFVVWDDLPGIPVGVVDFKLELVKAVE